MTIRNRCRVAAAASETMSPLWVTDYLLHAAARQAARYGRDVKDRRDLLEACGLLPYESVPNPYVKTGGKAIVNYERPGR
jgi:hypothetical protein